MRLPFPEEAVTVEASPGLAAPDQYASSLRFAWDCDGDIVMKRALFFAGC